MNGKKKRLAALKVLDHFVDNMGYWQESSILTEGLTEEEIQEVEAEVVKIQEQIRKRYELREKVRWGRR